MVFQLMSFTAVLTLPMSKDHSTLVTAISKTGMIFQEQDLNRTSARNDTHDSPNSACPQARLAKFIV